MRKENGFWAVKIEDDWFLTRDMGRALEAFLAAK